MPATTITGGALLDYFEITVTGSPSVAFAKNLYFITVSGNFLLVKNSVAGEVFRGLYSDITCAPGGMFGSASLLYNYLRDNSFFFELAGGGPPPVPVVPTLLTSKESLYMLDYYGTGEKDAWAVSTGGAAVHVFDQRQDYVEAVGMLRTQMPVLGSAGSYAWYYLPFGRFRPALHSSIVYETIFFDELDSASEFIRLGTGLITPFASDAGTIELIYDPQNHSGKNPGLSENYLVIFIWTNGAGYTAYDTGIGGFATAYSAHNLRMEYIASLNKWVVNLDGYTTDVPVTPAAYTSQSMTLSFQMRNTGTVFAGVQSRLFDFHKFYRKYV